MKSIIGEAGLEDEAEREELLISLGGIEYPEEFDQYLEYFDREAKQNGWPIAVIKAYCLGVINGGGKSQAAKIG